jgi:uncharacterized protein involved in exopolysaccharide biosynthesis
MSQDAIETLATQVRKYMEFARRVLRRWWLVALLVVFAAATSVAVALSLTRFYESQAMISYKETVDGSSVLSRDEQQREENWLQVKLKETFSSQTLQRKIINEFKLFPELRGSPAEVVLEEFSRKIKFETIGLDSFKISFEYKDPRIAQRVTQRLAEEFIQKNVAEKLAAANATLTFMQREVGKAKGEMDQIEQRLARFVSDHPEYQIDPVTGMIRVVTSDAPQQRSPALSVSSPELRALLAKKGQLEARLRMILNPAGDPRANQAKQNLERARQRFMLLRQKYTLRHPDVQVAQRALAQAQRMYQLAMEGKRAGDSNLNQIRNEIADVDQRISRESRRLSARRARPAPAAVPERQLSGKAKLEKYYYELTRDRTVTKAKYEQLQEGLLRSKVTAHLERKRAESQFTIVDRANLPQKPSRPSRTKLVLAGTSLGILLGLGLAVLLVIFDPRIYNEDDLKRVSDLPVLAQIPKE